jgi:predicted MPP superfamily phosphohydrolase
MVSMNHWNSQVLRVNCPGNRTQPDFFRHLLGVVFQKTVRFFFRIFPEGEISDIHFDTPNIHLSLPTLTPEFEGYRIIHLSDIHFGTWVDEERLLHIVERINQQQPDSIVITGDFVSALTTHLFDRLAPLLSLLKAKDGVFAVRGNHDCWANPGQFEQVMFQGHITILNNRVFTIQRSEKFLYLCGLDTAFYNQARLDRVIDQIPPGHTAILLAHEPDLADISAATGCIDLQLSGHTHGGQIILPLVGSPWLPRLARKYPRGLYRLGNMFLYTNRGIGTGSLPWRFRCPPEVALFTLHSPPTSA